MFAFRISLKNKKRALLLAVAAAAALSAVCVMLTAHTLRRPPDTATTQEGATYSLNVENGAYKAFFSQLGLDSAEEPSMERTVRIPSDFDGVYASYNELQKRSGLDLTPYRGLQARQLTFDLHSEKASRAVLLVKEERVIGGHLSNGEYGGELLPLL